MLETAVVEVPADTAEKIEGDNGVWIEALPARVYRTPMYGDVPVTEDKLQRFIHNFHSNIRGQDIATDYEHGMDQSKGLGASGWYRDFEIRPSSDDPSQKSLFAKVEFTEEAKKDIKDGKFKYWSLEWDDEYETDSGAIVPDVIIGGGLTNRPVAKRTMPINFSERMWNELDDETKKEFAVLTSKQRSSLPKSAFLYVEKDGTTHLPYRHSDGSLDLVHLRAAITRLSQKATGTVDGESWLTDSLRSSLLSKARKLLAGANKTSEWARKNADAIREAEAAGFTLSLNETAAMEHSDPGVNAPLYASAQGQPDPGFGQFVPRITGNPSADDIAIGTGSRWEPLGVSNKKDPTNDDEITTPEKRQPSGDDRIFNEHKGGELKVQLSEAGVNQLSKLLGFEIPDDADDADKVEKAFLDSANTAFSELKTFKDAVGASKQEKEFAERYPTYWREHQELIAKDRDTAARTFAESCSRLNRVNGKNDDETPKYEPTRNGLSALALETITEVHKKFSEGTATVADFESAVKAITNGGVVEFGEVGSSLEPEVHEVDSTTATGIAAARKLFAEKVNEVQSKDKDLNYSGAIAKAAELYPDLAAAYRATAA